MGAQGYCEDSPMPRFYRELHFSVIGEGPSNVICLDVLRAMSREPESYAAFLAELQSTPSADARLREIVEQLANVKVAEVSERDARSVVETMVLALQATLLERGAPGFVADAFLASRLHAGRGLTLGTLPTGTCDQQIIDRAFPA